MLTPNQYFKNIQVLTAESCCVNELYSSKSQLLIASRVQLLQLLSSHDLLLTFWLIAKDCKRHQISQGSNSWTMKYLILSTVDFYV